MIFLLALFSGIVLSHAFRFFPFLVSALSAAVIIRLLWKKNYLAPALLAQGFVYALLVFSPAHEEGGFQGVTELEGYFASPAVMLEGGFSQQFRVTGDPGPETLSVLSGREFYPGEYHTLKLRVSRPRKRINPGHRATGPYGVLLDEAASDRDSSNSLGVRLGRLRQGLNRHIREDLGPEAGSLVMAVTTGQRGEMPADLRKAFNESGLAHLLSISGTHFGLFAVLVFGGLRAGVRRLPVRALERVTACLALNEASALLTLPFMLFYLGLSGASIPSVRAFIMMSLFLIGLLVSRRGHWLNFLLVAAIFITMWDPGAALGLSFQLSFLAVFFIGSIARGIRPGYGADDEPSEGGGITAWAGWSRAVRAFFSGLSSDAPTRGLRGLPLRYLKKSLVITISASIGVFPLVAYYFHYAPLVSPLANLVVTPLVGFVLLPVSLAGSLLYIFTGHYLVGAVAGPVASACIWLARAFASVPYASVNVPGFPVAVLMFYYAGMLAWFVTKRKSMLALAVAPALLCAVIFSVRERPLGVIFLDAGRAEAAVLELPDGKVVLVDTGQRGREASDYLRYLGRGAIDAMVLTHGHDDHAGGVRRVFRDFRVNELWDSGGLVYPDGLLPYGVVRRELSRGDVVKGEGYSIYVLHPRPGFYTQEGGQGAEENNGSLVLRVEGKHESFLLTGDIEDEAVEDILHLGPWLRSSVLKVPHHGIDSRPATELARAVGPGTAVICAAGARDGLSEALGVPRVYVTGVDGAIRMEEKKGGLRVRPYASYALKETGDIREELRNLKRLFTVW